MLTVEQFKAALAEYDTQGGTQRESPLDILWYCYCVAAPLEDEPIRVAEANLEGVMAELSPASSDALFDVISQICLAYQRAAFLDGMRCGAQLVQYLSP